MYDMEEVYITNILQIHMPGRKFHLPQWKKCSSAESI